jgi:hypothetical protein
MSHENILEEEKKKENQAKMVLGVRERERES